MKKYRIIEFKKSSDDDFLKMKIIYKNVKKSIINRIIDENEFFYNFNIDLVVDFFNQIKILSVIIINNKYYIYTAKLK